MGLDLGQQHLVAAAGLLEPPAGVEPALHGVLERAARGLGVGLDPRLAPREVALELQPVFLGQLRGRSDHLELGARQAPARFHGLEGRLIALELELPQQELLVDGATLELGPPRQALGHRARVGGGGGGLLGPPARALAGLVGFARARHGLAVQGDGFPQALGALLLAAQAVAHRFEEQVAVGRLLARPDGVEQAQLLDEVARGHRLGFDQLRRGHLLAQARLDALEELDLLGQRRRVLGARRAQAGAGGVELGAQREHLGCGPLSGGFNGPGGRLRRARPETREDLRRGGHCQRACQ